MWPFLRFSFLFILTFFFRLFSVLAMSSRLQATYPAVSNVRFLWHLIVLKMPERTCKTSNANIKSFDFAVNNVFMKLLNTTNIEIVKYCQDQFGLKLQSEQIANRRETFNRKITGFKLCINKC